MEESEDNMSSEDIKYIASPPYVKVKPKKRSLVERELETNLTARVTSPVTNRETTSTSRYGRARRLKIESDNAETDKSMPKTLKSPKFEISPKNTAQSPVNKMHASNSPIRMKSPNKSTEHVLENQIENIYNENISLSRFGSSEKSISPSKRYPKVYIRKDLIQSKDKDKDMDETVTLIKNIFSPVKGTQKSSSHKVLDGSSEKHNRSRRVPNGLLDSSVVKTLDFDGNKKMKKESDKQPLSKNDIFEMEARCIFQVGDLAWARMGTYPFWPCIITREPASGLFVKKKLFGRVEHDVLHVTFFGDNGRRSWIVDSMLRRFMGQLEFEVTRSKFTTETKKKDPRLYLAYFISEKKMPQWSISVEEAEMLLREPKRLRIELLNNMLQQPKTIKTTPKVEKSKKIVRTDSDVSLSESLFDTLFSEDDCKINDIDRSRSKSRNKSLDVSEVVTACLDNMAAKTGITKIQRQSHMDRWLQKAKCKTPEKYQLNRKKSNSAKKKNQVPKVLPSIKPYTFRKSASESPKSTNNLLPNESKHDYSLILPEKKNQPEPSGIAFLSKVESVYAKEQIINDLNTVDKDTNGSNNIEAAVIINDSLNVTKPHIEHRENRLCSDIYVHCKDNGQDKKASEEIDCLNELNSSTSQVKELNVSTLCDTDIMLEEHKTPDVKSEISKDTCDEEEKQVKGNEKNGEMVNAFNTHTLSNVFFNQDVEKNKTLDVYLSDARPPDNEITEERNKEIKLINISVNPVEENGNSETAETKNNIIKKIDNNIKNSITNSEISSTDMNKHEKTPDIIETKIKARGSLLVEQNKDDGVQEISTKNILDTDKSNFHESVNIVDQPQDISNLTDILLEKNTVKFNDPFVKSAKIKGNDVDSVGSLNTYDENHVSEMKDSHQCAKVVELNEVSTQKIIRVIKNNIQLPESPIFNQDTEFKKVVKLNKLSPRKCIQLNNNKSHTEASLNIVDQMQERVKSPVKQKNLVNQKHDKRAQVTAKKVKINTDPSLLQESLAIEDLPHDINELSHSQLQTKAVTLNVTSAKQNKDNKYVSKLLNINNQKTVGVLVHSQPLNSDDQTNIIATVSPPQDSKVVNSDKRSLRKHVRLNKSKSYIMKESVNFEDQMEECEKIISDDRTILEEKGDNGGQTFLTNDKLGAHTSDAQSRDRCELIDSQLKTIKIKGPYVKLIKVKDNKVDVKESNINDQTYKEVSADSHTNNEDIELKKVSTRKNIRFDNNKCNMKESSGFDDRNMIEMNAKSNKPSTRKIKSLKKKHLNVDNITPVSDKSAVEHKIVLEQKLDNESRGILVNSISEAGTSIVQESLNIVNQLQNISDLTDSQLKTYADNINEPYLKLTKVVESVDIPESLDVNDQTDKVELTDSQISTKNIESGKVSTRQHFRSTNKFHNMQESPNFNYQTQVSDTSTFKDKVQVKLDNNVARVILKKDKLNINTSEIQDSLKIVDQPHDVSGLMDTRLRTKAVKTNESYVNLIKLKENILKMRESLNINDLTHNCVLDDLKHTSKKVESIKVSRSTKSSRNKPHMQKNIKLDDQTLVSNKSTLEDKIVVKRKDDNEAREALINEKFDTNISDIQASFNIIDQPYYVSERIDSELHKKDIITNETNDLLIKVKENKLEMSESLNMNNHTHESVVHDSQLRTKKDEKNKISMRKNCKVISIKTHMQENVNVDDQPQPLSTMQDKFIVEPGVGNAVRVIVPKDKFDNDTSVSELIDSQLQATAVKTNESYVKLIRVNENKLGIRESSNVNDHTHKSEFNDSQNSTKNPESNKTSSRKHFRLSRNRSRLQESLNTDDQAQANDKTKLEDKILVRQDDSGARVLLKFNDHTHQSQSNDTHKDMLTDLQHRTKDVELKMNSTQKVIELNKNKLHSIKYSLNLVDQSHVSDIASQLNTKSSLQESLTTVDQSYESKLTDSHLGTSVLKTNKLSTAKNTKASQNKADEQESRNFHNQIQSNSTTSRLDTDVVGLKEIINDVSDMNNDDKNINIDGDNAINQDVDKDTSNDTCNNNNFDKVFNETAKIRNNSIEANISNKTHMRLPLNHQNDIEDLNMTTLQQKPMTEKIHCLKAESLEESKMDTTDSCTISNKSKNKIKKRSKINTEDNNVLIDKKLKQEKNTISYINDVECIKSKENKIECVSEKTDIHEDMPLKNTNKIDHKPVEINLCLSNTQNEEDLSTINEIDDYTCQTECTKVLNTSISINTVENNELKTSKNVDLLTNNTVVIPENRLTLLNRSNFDHTHVTVLADDNSIKHKNSTNENLEKPINSNESKDLEIYGSFLNANCDNQKNIDAIKNTREVNKNDDLAIQSYLNLDRSARTNRIIVNGFHIEEELCLDEYSPSNIFEENNELPHEHQTGDIKKTDIYRETSTIVTEFKRKETDPDCASITSEDSEMSLSRRKLRWKEKQLQNDKKKALEDPEFLKYLEFRQDTLIDEHPELSQEEITNYLYKTWLYEGNLKADKKSTDEIDQTTLVKGLQEPMPVKKVRKKNKVINEKLREVPEKEIPNSSEEISPKEKSKRAITQIRPFYTEDLSDIEDEIELFEIFKRKPSPQFKKEAKLNTEINTISTQDNKLLVPKMEEIPLEVEDDLATEKIDIVEIYFQQLTAVKPNLFKGLIREKVCEICEKVGNLVKCKTCHCMFHIDCVNNKDEVFDVPVLSKSRKKKKKRGRKPKNFEGTNPFDSGSQSDEKSQDANVSEEMSIENDMENNIVANADDFEAQLVAKMKEILDNPNNFECDSNTSEDVLDWSDTDAGNCKIVDIKPRQKNQITTEEFKCNNCLKYDTPVCFVCRSPVSPKDKVEHRQRCQVAHCYQYYHLECLDHWPQTQFNAGERSKNNKRTEYFEAMSCPRHVCHTCVCDDPRGCKTRFSGDKLARCVRCPATYHTFTKCLPAGTQILTGSHIICPRHYQHRPGKVPCHVNTGWCFICALGGTLICCEYCPTSFHAECLNIDPPEGGYMCEDCETGRLPLYGEMVWVKLGQYRWWPGIILHPSEIPDNIMAVKHSAGEFVVRFFGQYDHYWVNRGRVFPFQEGDSGKISSQRSKIDAAFTMAVEHAQRACQILKTATPNQEESQDIASSLLPPHYVKLKVNKPCGTLTARRPDLEESSLTQCECDPNDVEPCGPYSQCLNRMLLTECGPMCRAGERCNNRAFEKRLYPKMEPYRTPHRGWGLKALEEIKAGQFVIEYVGELISEEEFRRRMCRKHEVRDENFYFLTLDKERMIDAGPKGNLARFMNHSCEGNCETQKWTVLGDVRVGLFAINDIPANSELTFNYNLESTGIEKKRCMCGAKRCSGYIGAKPKQDEPQPKKNKQGVKKTNKKRKTIELSPSTSKAKPKQKLGRLMKPREMTEIEKDLLIIKNATNAISSDSECSRLSIESKDSRGFKRKRIGRSSEEANLSPSVKRAKVDGVID